MRRRALISVFVKDGVLELASFLHKNDWEILSTGGTAKYLVEQGEPIYLEKLFYKLTYQITLY